MSEEAGKEATPPELLGTPVEGGLQQEGWWEHRLKDRNRESEPGASAFVTLHCPLTGETLSLSCS